MGMTYGASLLSSIPCDCIETQAQKLALLDQFARKGYIMELYEVIDDKVVKFINGISQTKEAVLYEWVEDEDKIQQIKAVIKRGGSRPYSYASFLDGFHMLIPDEEASGDSLLKLSNGSTFKFSAMPIPTAIERLERINQRISAYKASYWEKQSLSLDQYLEFHNEIITDLTACMEAGVIYTMD